MCVCVCVPQQHYVRLYAMLQCVSAIKAMVVERPHPVDGPLSACIEELLVKAISDADRHVRRAGVVSLSGVSTSKILKQTRGGVREPGRFEALRQIAKNSWR